MSKENVSRLSGGGSVEGLRSTRANASGYGNVRQFIDVNVPNGQETIDRAVRLLSGIEGGIEKAMRSATERAADRLRRSDTAAIRERYAIKPANIRDEENVDLRFIQREGGTVQACVTFRGRRIPLYRFDGASPAQPTKDPSRYILALLYPDTPEEKYRRVHPSMPARGHVLKSTGPFRFRDAFVATMPTGHTGIFERTGGRTSHDNEEIQELWGPSVPQMLGNEAVVTKLANEASNVFLKELDHNVLAILNGYMR